PSAVVENPFSRSMFQAPPSQTAGNLELRGWNDMIISINFRYCNGGRVTIKTIKMSSVTSHTKIEFLMARQPLSFSHHLRGWTSLTKKTTLAARFTQTKLTARSNAAPDARSNRPSPSNKPTVTAGGSRATATMTPTSTLDSPAVIDIAAAAPEARA